ncbi:hypothetical protein CQW23_07224 [Capsicum baccatum]|uniref:Replication factor A C-terminal domain-containing protein n=1 Tax=Capsicum baccatum TaxID=33114 RepID=A0A2G2X5J5_CAPBA|nr:hypothetical protein CQW23_07224 [Capsicum baccatum]
MDQRLLVDFITKETTDWTCKVQVIDKFRPCKSKDSSVHFHTILVQDEKEQQVSIVLYSDDIPKYKNLFLLFHTYLVSCAKVRDPRGYLIRAGTYEWVADKYTIVEPITDNDGLEAPLPALEKLSPLPFSAIEQQHPGAEFDLLAVVVNCSALQYSADQSKHFREAIVMDQRYKLFLWKAEYRFPIIPNHFTCLPVQTAITMCHFNIDITDSNGTITTTVSEALAERILSLTVDQIYDKVVVQKQPLSIACINRQLDCELFKLQLQKSAFRFPNQKPDAPAIASFTKTEQTDKPGKVVGPGFAYDFGNKEKHDPRPQSRNVVDPSPQIMPSAYC